MNRNEEFELQSPDQTDSQIEANRRTFAKPELAYGFASRLASSRKFTQVAKSRKFHAHTVD